MTPSLSTSLLKMASLSEMHERYRRGMIAETNADLPDTRWVALHYVCLVVWVAMARACTVRLSFPQCGIPDMAFQEAPCPQVRVEGTQGPFLHVQDAEGLWRLPRGPDFLPAEGNPRDASPTRAFYSVEKRTFYPAER